MFKLNHNIYDSVMSFWFMVKPPLTQELMRLKDSKTIRNKVPDKYSAWFLMLVIWRVRSLLSTLWELGISEAIVSNLDGIIQQTLCKPALHSLSKQIHYQFFKWENMRHWQFKFFVIFYNATTLSITYACFLPLAWLVYWPPEPY